MYNFMMGNKDNVADFLHYFVKMMLKECSTEQLSAGRLSSSCDLSC